MKNDFKVQAVHSLLWLMFGGAVVLFVWNLLYGVSTLSLLKVTIAELDISIALRVDSLSTLLLVMVTLLGGSIGHYSNRYLAGESRQWYFYRYLLFTLIAVSLLILSSNLLMFFGMWLATSYGLHKLLLYYRERPQAVYAARKKWVISRIGDLSLLVAIGLTYLVFGTFEFNEIFAAADLIAKGSEHENLLAIIGFLFAAGAMTKSAQFPFHFWLPETMETPAPVSALMHAGIINAGGFLMIRLSPIFQHSDAAHLLLAVFGALTAVFGALVMITQNDIKKKLAYSTISQMGMMMFACGLSAYAIALFHMIAHSFYKAHAFLSTGMLVDEAKKTGFKLVQPSKPLLVIASFIGLILIGVGTTYLDGAYFAYFTYGAVLLLGLVQNFGQHTSADFSKLLVYGRVGGLISVAFGFYVLIEYFINYHLNPLVPVVWESGLWHSPHVLVSFISYGIFVCGLWLSARLMNPQSQLMHRLYVYLWNGGYYSHRSTRLLSRFSVSS